MENTFAFPGRDMLVPDIVKSQNCILIDVDGNQYIDLEAGVWCTSIGHANQAVRSAVMAQMDCISHVGFCYSSGVVERAAGAVLDLIDHSGGRCSFLCSGSESVEYGVRVLRSLLKSKRIMTMSDSYFGAYGDASVKDSAQWYLFDWESCGKCDQDKCSNECPVYSEIPFDEVGAFLFEPGSSSGMVRFPPSKLINCIVEDVAATDGLVMVNEVTTGVGRTGKWFGFQHYEMQPDIVAMGKGIGNGYPVSAVSLNRRVVDLLGPEAIAYGQSHLNDPLGAAVVEAVIGEINAHNLIQHAEVLSDVLMDGLQRVAAGSQLIECVRGRGLMAILVMADHIDVSKVAELHRRLISRGFIVDHRLGTNALRMHPALTIGVEDIYNFIAVLEEVVGAMEIELG
ncbi:aminotransferase class III-fold pyridoxal phosphate-dependent enzyme [Desulfovibrio sp. JC022]|uniref:aminotransferase class III-fold pyridoxal phosphate-dependent enzyme n=1 Tax=Desulfovibrio sp. JC022 TaxID=2593642 RepID=UPI0013D09DA5|nr:aminotransferase class III-fold pyridoxal phosphate-dependent enzyme [Desulfovibrio sp. JC022]NDV23629.1 aminotransferase class III-fold pyridoxal phosphate-dependent enzyme [Desulfovibrio sp. JC022]